MSALEHSFAAFRTYLRGRLLAAGGQAAVAIFDWSGTKDDGDKLGAWLNRQLIAKVGGSAARVGRDGAYADLRHCGHQFPDGVRIAVMVVLPSKPEARTTFATAVEELRPEVERRGGKNLVVFHLHH